MAKAIDPSLHPAAAFATHVMTALETVVVSRKTPRDGKLEISPETAAALGGDGARLTIVLDQHHSAGSIVTMPCACKGTTSHRVHVFLQSDDFRQLVPAQSVALSLQAVEDRPEVVATVVQGG